MEFIVEREDHTVGNLVRQCVCAANQPAVRRGRRWRRRLAPTLTWARLSRLLANPEVLFAAYSVDHPLQPKIRIRVYTKKSTTPIKALDAAIKEADQTIVRVREEFEVRLAGKGGWGGRTRRPALTIDDDDAAAAA